VNRVSHRGRGTMRRLPVSSLPGPGETRGSNGLSRIIAGYWHRVLTSFSLACRDNLANFVFNDRA